ncbi:MAG: hypothetical protein DMF35_06145 [Verrucomicrobia bacterium]|nr:MAG: hypothetical protein DMF35_06145 [Verrucomicrobiota bacterium]
MILVVIGMVAILSFRVFAQPFPEPTEPPASKATFVLKIKTVTPVKDEARFEDVLKHLKTQLYDIVLHEENGKEKHLLPNSNAKLDIKTDKVTTSEAAKNAPNGELTLIQTRATRQVASMDTSDIKSVLDELQP